MRATTMILLLLSSSHAFQPYSTTSRPVASHMTRTGVVRALAPDLHGITALADAAEPIARMTEEARRAAAGELGWWGTYIKTVEDGIFTLHDKFTAANVPGAYGLSIFCFVLGVKAITLPLNFQQLTTSSQMKAMKPQQDIIKTWYGDNKDLLNMETGLLFEKFDVNPLAGCLPSLAQIPVFLGVYYSVTAIAKAKIYEEGFLWIPSLSGPIADRSEGISWLTEGWVNGAPRLGWEDTLAYLTLPVILVCTQTLSLNLLGSFEALENDDSQATATTAVVLRLLPFMLGWFAMNAPSGLGLYWVFNNMLTTAQTVTIKKLVERPVIDIPVDLAALGPRRDPLPLPDLGSAPDWVKQAEAIEAASASDATAEAAGGSDGEATAEKAPAEVA
uniref:Membrane insertase YidC/Oxa/ALB C-terminal domain-containing protein n=1 Tax=Haptolina brevifila TaxID=156173 RepID=A0A7S2N3C6_9EUKA|mmetsp:Transcript_65762/g.130296  ORF Transcript_65762/g.130296 Transcript_65762/m.130296 type:complete len:389 (+) Transcript_65762:1-1167(+)|eukprot:CAMPEP_0174704954 /NCGR_PEP_ID=MMETSP1094-20130205/8346_1 /TAXON_ID=156173 /ORGANISM="Chrysochromulina brevifilum, Strain UTEX LB 985" /LENGTH=388 /DNA_ID=CAMNT_0015903057 /DNA_START=1 /DNA_END=1167 /DNA_ORIENTATION=+